MKILKSYKTELKPNKAQAAILRSSAGCARFAYNWGLARRIEEYKKTGKSSTAITQHKQLNALKASEFPWMYEVSKCAPQEALRDLDKAYAGFFRRAKAGGAPGFPKFKSKHRTTPSFRISSKQKISKTHIGIPRCGKIRLKEHGVLADQRRRS